MDENTGQNPAPPPAPTPDFQPPAPSYQPPAPTYQPLPTPAPAVAPQYESPQSGVPAAPQYAPPQSVTPVAPPRKKRTWLWVVLGLVVLSVVGCCIAMAVGGLWIFNSASEPTASIDAANQAALDGDQAEFDKYFDADSVAEYAYTDVLDFVKASPDYAALVTEFGEDEAGRMLREEIIPPGPFMEEMKAQYALTGDEAVFPDYAVTSSSIQDSTAEVTITANEDGEQVTYVLGMDLVSTGDESVWRITRILNIGDMLQEEVPLSE